jgi:hypothetical protein
MTDDLADYPTADPDRTCPNCGEDGTFVEADDKVCVNCHYVPSGSDDGRDERTDTWEQFWDERAEYSGHYGDDRKKVVGSFCAVWFYEDNNYF